MTTTPESTLNPEVEKQQLNPRVESLAIPLARDYAEKNYPLREDGTFEPAWRGVNGEKAYRGKSTEDVAADLVAEGWTPEAAAAEAQGKVVDIANTPYNEYSDYWKEQNRGGAEFLIKGLLDQFGADEITGLDLADPAVRSKFGTLIHNNWIERNEWVKDPQYGNPELAKDFGDLNPDEQQKDIDQLAVLIDWQKKQYLEEFGFTEDEITKIQAVTELYDKVAAELKAQDPDTYDENAQQGYPDKKDAAMVLTSEAHRKIQEKLGEPVNWARTWGYADIMNGRPRIQWASRFGAK